jgi:hypothetical protein
LGIIWGVKMSGIITATNLQTSNIKSATGNTGATIASNGDMTVSASRKLYAPGHIVQIQSDILTTYWASSTSSTAWEDTPLSVTITPSSTSSKIMITGMINFSGESGDHIDFKVVRNGADILLPTSTLGNRVASHIHYYCGTANDVYQIIPGNIQLLDSPSSTSALTYTLRAATPHDAGYAALLNQVATDADATYNGYTVSTLTCWEVAG